MSRTGHGDQKTTACDPGRRSNRPSDGNRSAGRGEVLSLVVINQEGRQVPDNYFPNGFQAQAGEIHDFARDDVLLGDQGGRAADRSQEESAAGAKGLDGLRSLGFSTCCNLQSIKGAERGEVSRPN